MADVWAPLRYGWSHIYWCKIEGLPVVWCQRDTSATRPSGFSATSATLVLQDSAKFGGEIDRDAGIAAGYPLSFKLLDDDTLDGYMTRPGAICRLTADASSSATTLTVDDTTDFASSGSIWVGRELITYSGKTSTTFTGCTRGVAGYAHAHLARSTAIIADTPSVWRGRLVTLYAQPCDATGYAPGSTWESTSSVVWRGYITGEPVRARDGSGWDLQALPIDRMLARPLAGEMTGTVISSDGRFKVAADSITIWLTRTNTSTAAVTKYVAALSPFADAGYSPGDLISMTEAEAAISDAWSTWASNAGVGAEFGDLIWHTVGNSGTSWKWPSVDVDDRAPLIRLLYTGAPQYSYEVAVAWFGTTATVQLDGKNHPPKTTGDAADLLSLKLTLSGSPYAISTWNSNAPPATLVPALAIRMDDGELPALPNNGRVVVGEVEYRYATATVTTATGLVVLRNLQPTGAPTPVTPAVGETARIISGNAGTMADCVRRLLHSSGEASLRGTYDTLPGFSGLGLPTDFTDDDAIGAVLGGGWWSLVEVDAQPASGSVSDAVGQALGLSGLALAMTDTYDAESVLTAVHTAPAETGWTATITDAEVVSYGQADVASRTIQGPNKVAVQLADEGEDVILRDQGRIAAEGAIERRYNVPIEQRQHALPGIVAWASARIIGDVRASLVDLDVVPWVDAQLGAVVSLDLTHPSTWDADTGQPGISAIGRVLRRQIDPSTGVQSLSVLVDGRVLRRGICPAAPVTATDHATSPTYLEVSSDYLPIMIAAMAYADSNSDTLRVLHYEPGEGSEGVTEGFEISAVTDTGSACRLTVDSIVGSPTVSVSTSWLTWPESANDDTFQASWMHDADGSRWS